MISYNTGVGSGCNEDSGQSLIFGPSGAVTD